MNTRFKGMVTIAIFGVSAILMTERSATANDIVETAVDAGSFKTLTAALGAAGLVDALKGDGPFTVFAPTDEAFAKLPEGTIEMLLKPENRDRLKAILTYHVVSGRVEAKQVVRLNAAKTLNGQRVDIEVSDGGVKVDGSNVVKTDIACSNGIIHVIDSVLLPPEKKKLGAADARNMIYHTVARGTKLYNHGHHAACAKMYHDTARKMIAEFDDMPASVMLSLTSAVHKANHTHCPMQRAWTLRHSLDHTYMAMKPLR